MSRRRKRDEGPMPVSGAGLIRFFEEEISGVKVKPVLVVIMAMALIITVVLANIFL